jgi:hypothetical protein
MKNLIEVYTWLPSDKYLQLKSYAHGLTSVFGSNDLCGIGKISLQVRIKR